MINKITNGSNNQIQEEKKVSSKTKPPGWPAIILPPLPILLLCFVPLDMATTPIWLIGWIAFIISVIFILMRVIKILFLERSNNLQRKVLVLKLVRPLLVVIFVILAHLLIKLSIASADQYALKVAREIQRETKMKGVCPENIEGWSPARYGCGHRDILYGEYGTRYVIRYFFSEDKKEFEIIVRHNIDERCFITGGVNKPLKAEIFGDGISKEIPIDNNK